MSHKIFVTLNLRRGVLREIWQVSLDMQVFLPFLGEAILYLKTYVKDLVQVLRKHFRRGWGVQANAYYAYIGGVGGLASWKTCLCNT